MVGVGPNTVSQSTLLSADPSESLAPTKLLGENSVSSSQPIMCVCVCQSVLAEFLAELSELGAGLIDSSFGRQHSRNSIPPVS